MRDLFEALVSGVVLGIPFVASFFVPVFLAYEVDRKLAGHGRLVHKPSQAWQIFVLIWIFAGPALGIKVVEAISSATGIK